MQFVALLERILTHKLQLTRCIGNKQDCVLPLHCYAKNNKAKLSTYEFKKWKIPKTNCPE